MMALASSLDPTLEANTGALYFSKLGRLFRSSEGGCWGRPFGSALPFASVDLQKSDVKMCTASVDLQKSDRGKTNSPKESHSNSKLVVRCLGLRRPGFWSLP